MKKEGQPKINKVGFFGDGEKKSRWHKIQKRIVSQDRNEIKDTYRTQKTRIYKENKKMK